MKSKNPVYSETLMIAIGEVICVAIMLGLFALAGHFDQKVLLGGIVGGVLVIANFFLMAVGTSLAADRAEAQNVKGGMTLIQVSRLLRSVGLFAVLAVCAISKQFNLWALVLPFLFQWPVLALGEFFRKSGERKS